ncbi:MAG: twitching motility protein PilT [Parasphingorhabdus sp.]|jgi:twitching motility protein PilT
MFGKQQHLTGSVNNSIKQEESGEDYQAIIEDIVGYAADKGGSDIHLRVGGYPAVRLNGDLKPIEEFSVLSLADMEGLLQVVLTARDRQILEEKRQCDTSLGFASIGRVRVNAFYQRGSVALAIRLIKTSIPTLDELGVPDVLYKISRLRSGLILTTGSTGSGKSTTLAAIVDDINQRYQKHIITIEDPVEFLFRDKQSIVAQREIGIDALSFKDAMSAAMREDPDVILLSDLRDTESMEFAMDAAETGHLVLGTVHSPTAPDAISRIVGSFPSASQNTIRTKLSQNLKAVVGQRLLPNRDKTGRVLACEVMLVSQRIQELILDPMKVAEISDLMRKSKSVDGVMSFDQSIFDLFKKKLINEETALRFSSSPNDMGLRIKGFSN